MALNRMFFPSLKAQRDRPEPTLTTRTASLLLSTRSETQRKETFSSIFGLLVPYSSARMATNRLSSTALRPLKK